MTEPEDLLRASSAVHLGRPAPEPGFLRDSEDGLLGACVPGWCVPAAAVPGMHGTGVLNGSASGASAAGARGGVLTGAAGDGRARGETGGADGRSVSLPVGW